MRILIVEDDKDMNKIITKLLHKNGYQTDSCFDGEQAQEHILQCQYDAIVMDIMMPKINGYALIQWLRDAKNNVPVLMLTAKDAIEDKVKGLDLGADDYLVKPFNIDEFLARIRAITRKNLSVKSNILSCGNLTLNRLTREVKIGDTVVSLIPKEFTILEHLLRNKGIVMSREQLENQIWNFENFGSSNNIDVYMSRLRKKIEYDKPRKMIHTIKGVGWVIKDED